MRFTLTIDLDGAAFEDDPEELTRILRYVAERVEPGNEWRTGNVRDTNGNTVGEWKITDL